MATLTIRKISDKVWKHSPSDGNSYIISKLYIKSDGDNIRVCEFNGAIRAEYNFADIVIYNIGGGAETFTSSQEVMERLEALNYVGFFSDGEVTPSSLISSDANNALIEGTDSKLFVPESSNDTQVYKTISTNTSLNDTYHNAIVWVTATCNITIVSGLRSDFTCTFRTLTGAIATFLTSGTTINAESDGDVMSAKSMCLVATYSANNFILSGGGLS